MYLPRGVNCRPSRRTRRRFGSRVTPCRKAQNADIQVQLHRWSCPSKQRLVMGARSPCESFGSLITCANTRKMSLQRSSDLRPRLWSSPASGTRCAFVLANSGSVRSDAQHRVALRSGTWHPSQRTNGICVWHLQKRPRLVVCLGCELMQLASHARPKGPHPKLCSQGQRTQKFLRCTSSTLFFDTRGASASSAARSIAWSFRQPGNEQSCTNGPLKMQRVLRDTLKPQPCAAAARQLVESLRRKVEPQLFLTFGEEAKCQSKPIAEPRSDK